MHVKNDNFKHHYCRKYNIFRSQHTFLALPCTGGISTMVNCSVRLRDEKKLLFFWILSKLPPPPPPPKKRSLPHRGDVIRGVGATS